MRSRPRARARLSGELAVVLVLRQDERLSAGPAMVLVAGGLVVLPWRRRGGGGVPTPTPGVPPPTFVHYHTDHLGSTQVVTDGVTGAIAQQLRYSAWGELRARLGAGGQPMAHSYRFQFTGYEEEESSGLNYAGARYYDAGLGLFLTHDPLRQFASPYSYGYGDPVNGTDPTGSSWVLLAVAFALGFGITSIQAAPSLPMMVRQSGSDRLL